MGETFVQKAADGSVCSKLWHHCDRSAILQTMENQGRSVLQHNAKQNFILIYSYNLDVFVTKEWQYRK